MTQPDVEEFVNRRNRRFRWEAFLPKRKAWLQTLLLLPFGLPVGNFLGASWQFSVNAIVEERQYPLGVLSMAINLLLPSLFFAFLFHWGWFVWQQDTEASPTWYPQGKAAIAGAYATLTIAVSFGIVGLFTHTLGVCGNPGWGAVGATLLCNLDGYGFESKSWFGAWFIIAAYCYQAKGSIFAIGHRIYHRQSYAGRFPFGKANSGHINDFNSVATAHGEISSHDDFRANAIDPSANHSEEQM